MDKTCNICKELKPLTKYRKFGVNNYRNSCDECDIIERRKEKIKNSINKGLFVKADDPINGMIICILCGKNKLITQFRKTRFECIDCERKNGREYRKSDKGKKKTKTWVNENRDYMLKLQANWYQKHKHDRRELDAFNRKHDPIYNLKSKLRSDLSYITCATYIYHNKFMIYFNCTDTFLIKWTKFNFTNQMDLHNHGTYWHFDHVIPIATFKNLINNENQRYLCFSWFNVSPIEKTENLIKHHHINTKTRMQIINHLQSLLKFCETENIMIDIKEYIKLCATHLDAGNS